MACGIRDSTPDIVIVAFCSGENELNSRNNLLIFRAPCNRNVTANAIPTIVLVCSFVADAARADSREGAIDVAVVYTGEYLSNLSGGLREDGSYLDNLDVTFDIDADALWGLKNTQFFVYGLYNNGTKFSENIVGDAQVASNLETGVQALRLYEAWINMAYGNTSQLLFGLYDLNSEFDVLSSSALFFGSAHGIGTDISQSGLNGPSIFPSTSLALRFSSQLAENWLYRVAVLDGVPGDPSDPGGTRVELSSDEGALVIGEVERHTENSRLLVGGWAYTAEFDKFSGGDIPSSDLRGRGNNGFYARGETVIYDRRARLTGFIRLGVAEGEMNSFERYVGAGINVERPFRSRPEDVFGVAVASAHASSELRREGLDAGAPLDAHETAIELTYSAKINDYLALQPNLQYIVNPGLDPDLDNALVVGLRFELQLLQ